MMNYVYESKCRACGDVSRRTYAAVSPDSFFIFRREMEARSLKPQHYECPECEETTEQDVIFYGIDTQVVASRRYVMMVD